MVLATSRVLGVLVLAVTFASALHGSPVTGADERSYVGTYLRANKVEGGTNTESLEINADKTVLWTQTLVGKPPVVMTGIWNYRGEALVVVLGTRDGEQLPAGTRVVFDRSGKKLKGRIYDRKMFGTEDLVFRRSN